MITSAQLSLQHVFNWAPVLLWLVVSFIGVGGAESHSKNEMLEYFDQLHIQRKVKRAVNRRFNSFPVNYWTERRKLYRMLKQTKGVINYVR